MITIIGNVAKMSSTQVVKLVVEFHLLLISVGLAVIQIFQT